MKILRKGFSYAKIQADDKEIKQLLYPGLEFNKNELLLMYDGSKMLYRGENVWYIICHTSNALRDLLAELSYEYRRGEKS